MHGMPVYAAIDAESTEVLNGRDILVADVKGPKATRTTLQNASIHLYLTHLAKALNDAGMDMVSSLKILSKDFRLDWTLEGAKEKLFKPVIMHTFGIESTKKLEPGQVGTAYEALNRATSEKLGVGVPFPDKWGQMHEKDIADGK